MADYTPGFELWWKHYPQYKRKGKGAAFKSWQKYRLEDKSSQLIEVIELQAEYDEHFKKYTPMPSTYLNQARYDDDLPKPKRAYAPAPEPDYPEETDPYVKAVKRVAFAWLWRRRGIPDAKVEKALSLIHQLALDAKELHQQGKLTDAFAKTIREELDALVAR